MVVNKNFSGDVSPESESGCPDAVVSRTVNISSLWIDAGCFGREIHASQGQGRGLKRPEGGSVFSKMAPHQFSPPQVNTFLLLSFLFIP